MMSNATLRNTPDDISNDGMDAGFMSIDSRLDGMDTRFTAIESRLDGMDARFTVIESRLTAIESRLTKIETQLQYTATKEDLQKLKVWVLGGLMGGMTLAATAVVIVLRLMG